MTPEALRQRLQQLLAAEADAYAHYHQRLGARLECEEMLAALEAPEDALTMAELGESLGMRVVGIEEVGDGDSR